MRYLIAWLALMFLTAGCNREEPVTVAEQTDSQVVAEAETAPEPEAAQFDEAAAEREAKQAILLFAGELQLGFSTALRNEGPVGAIRVCNTEAMVITNRISEEMGLNLGRVSLKNRNPGNAPNEWQTKVMLDFEDQHAAGGDLAYMTWSEVAGEGDEREFRFMKPIPTHDVCLNCHGTSLTPEVKQALDELYPEDMARGFSKGDIRGAFVVTSAVTQ